MALLQTTDTLVEEVRSLTNELNQDALQTERDILPALNRAQDHMMSILSRHYPEPYLVEYPFDIVSSRPNYTIPEDAWSDMVTKIEIVVPGQDYRHEVTRAKYRDTTRYRSDTRPNVPNYYLIRGREIELIPQPSGTYDGVMWYLQAPENLVTQQGRITFVSASQNRINVDAIGDSISTDVESLESWVNIIDGQTGVVKATCQVQSITGTQGLKFKSNISSNILTADGTILNRTPTTDLSQVLDNKGNIAVHPNDYICSIKGTCVPRFFTPGKNFVVNYAAADCGRAIGTPSDMLYRLAEKFEKEIKDSWTGREASLRVKNKSPHWQPRRRLGSYRK